MIVETDRACLTAITSDTGTMEEGETFYVQFNPETLEIQSTSKVQEDKGEKQNKTPVQVVAGTERRLSVQLIFDETLTGDDVRNRTSKIVGLMRAGEGTLDNYGKRGADKDVMLPSVVKFEWGNLTFQGTISECSETLEYFSPQGVPLRASVTFSLTQQDAVFEAETGAGAGPVDGGLDVADGQALPPGSDVQDMAKKNGVEDMRNPGAVSLFAQADVEGGSVRGALGASASAGAGIGGGIGGGASFGLAAASIASGKIGFGASASAGIGLGVDLGGGVSLRGGAGDLGLDVADALGVPQDLSVSSDIGLGMDAFSGLKDASATASGAVAKLDSGLKQLGKAGSGGAKGGALFTAKAEVGAKIDLGALLFPEDQK